MFARGRPDCCTQRVGSDRCQPNIRRAKAAAPPARDRLVSLREFEALAIAAGDNLDLAQARAFHAFLFAVETTMRAGEIVGSQWADIDVDQQTAHLSMTKNGCSRTVPLSSEAVRLLQQLPEANPVFGLNSAQIDVLWRKVRDAAALKGLRFHDSRHHAITRLEKKLDVLDLACMVGHKNLNQLLAYYNEDASSIAKRLG